MASIHYRFAEQIARMADEMNAESRAEQRANGARRGRESAESAAELAQDAAISELNRRLACGLITKAEHERRLAALQGDED